MRPKLQSLRWFAISGILCVVPLLDGCATKFVVRVDSIRAPDVQADSDHLRYILLPGMKDVAESDLQYREFAEYVRKVLSGKGYTQALQATEADVAVFMNYGLGDPQTSSYAYSVPVYGQTGGGTATYTGTTYGSGGTTTTTGTVYQQPRYGVVGSQLRSGTVTTYPRWLVLDAIDLRSEDQSIHPLWKTTVTSSGWSNDLRRVFPIMAAAASLHVGTNTGKQVVVVLKEKDRRVRALQGEN